jgi:GINS complex subunit 1
MNYGQRGRDLLLDLQRSDWLPAYGEDGIRATLLEINAHTEELTALVKAANRANADAPPPPGAAKTGPAIEHRPALILHDAAIRRNKRCLLAYHAHRLDKLRVLRWDAAGTLPPSRKGVLSEAEVDFFVAYDRLAARHALGGPLGGLDWGADQDPPDECFVQVRVARGGLGRIETDACGTVELEVGSMHYLPRGDVEHLIRSGALVHLSGEESY